MSLIIYAILASAISGSLCGVSGTLISRLRISTLVFAIAHGALCGAALGLAIGADTLITAISIAILTAMIIGPISDATGIPSSTIAMVLFSIYNALTFIFILLSPGPALAAEKVGGILWGSVLAVTNRFLTLLIATLFLYVLILRILWRRFQSILFDRELAESEGVNTKLYVYLLIILVGVIITLSLKIVGGFLVFSLLYIPAACSMRISDHLTGRITSSAIIGSLSGVSGVLVSFYLNLPIGACIVIAASIIFVISILIAYIK